MVGDITYIRTGRDFSYLSLIADTYSHKIMGWVLDNTLQTKGSLAAWQKVVRSLPKAKEGLIHHSGRSIQYYSKEYIQLLQAKAILAYNQLCPHAFYDYLIPAQAHLREGPLKKRWRKKERRNLTNINQLAIR